jgi:hypothetical protein
VHTLDKGKLNETILEALAGIGESPRSPTDAFMVSTG